MKKEKLEATKGRLKSIVQEPDQWPDWKVEDAQKRLKEVNWKLAIMDACDGLPDYRKRRAI